MVLELKDEALDKEKITNDVAKTFQDICRLKLDKVEFVTKGTLPEVRKVIIDERTWD